MLHHHDNITSQQHKLLLQDLVGGGEQFELVFVSSDKTAEDQMAYMKESHGDWLAVQHNTVLAAQLKKVVIDHFEPGTECTACRSTR